MIDSETINFDLATYGKFMIDYRGLKYLGNLDGLPYSDSADDLTDSFNAIYSSNSHITPIEALKKIPIHFAVKKSYLDNVDITNQKEIEAPTEDKLF